MLPLHYAYGPHIGVTLSEASSSIVVRSEHQFRKDDRYRLTLRKHFHEDDSTGRLASQQDHVRPLTEQVIAAIEKDLQRRIKGGELQGPEAPYQKLVAHLRQLLQGSDGSRDLSSADLRTTVEGCFPVVKLAKDVNQVLRTHFLAPGRCNGFAEHQQFGKYLGFIDQRVARPGMENPLAMGLLVPPRHFRHSPQWVLVTGHYGPLFGAPSFPATFYVMHDSMSGGSYCAQASLIMALGMLSDRGAKILGPMDITYLAKQRINVGGPSKPRCTKTESKSVSAFSVDGLSILDVARLFYKRPTLEANDVIGGDVGQPEAAIPAVGGRLPAAQVNATADVIRFPFRLHNRRMFLRLAEAYIRARCPVVLFVDANDLWHPGKSAPPNPHSIVVVGYRAVTHGSCYDPETLRPTISCDLALHDPSGQPFLIRSTGDVLQAAARFSQAVKPAPARQRSSPPMEACFVGDHTMRSHPFDCLERIQKEFREEYHKWIVPLDETTLKSVNYQIDLLHSNDILRTLRRYLDGRKPGDPALRADSYAKVLKDAMEAIPLGLYWVVTTFSRDSKQDQWIAETIYAFSSAKNADCECDLKLARVPGTSQWKREKLTVLS